MGDRRGSNLLSLDRAPPRDSQTAGSHQTSCWVKRLAGSWKGHAVGIWSHFSAECSKAGLRIWGRWGQCLLSPFRLWRQAAGGRVFVVEAKRLLPGVVLKKRDQSKVEHSVASHCNCFPANSIIITSCFWCNLTIYTYLQFVQQQHL